MFTVQVSGIHLRCTLDVGHCMSGFFGFPSSIIGEMQSSKLMCAPDCKSGSTTVWFSPYPSKYYGADRLQKGASALQWGQIVTNIAIIWALLCTFHPTNLVELILGALICLLQSIFSLIIFQCFSSLFIMSYCKCMYHVCIRGRSETKCNYFAEVCYEPA